jgi:hypothetical protein
MRQSEIETQKMLQSVRYGTVTDPQHATLRSYVVGGLKAPDFSDEKYAQAIVLFGNRKPTEIFNHERHKQQVSISPGPHLRVHAIDKLNATFQGDQRIKTHLLAAKDTDTAGLPGMLSLTVGDRVMLKHNICVSYGLANNALGKVVGYLMPPSHDCSTDIIESMPLGVLVEFDKFDCPLRSFVQTQYGSRVVPILPATISFNFKKMFWVTRTMIPLKLAYATTVHNSQSETYTCPVIIDLLSMQFNNRLPYVALTRARRLSQVTFLRDFPKSAVNKALSVELKNEQAKLLKDAERTLQRYGSLIQPTDIVEAAGKTHAIVKDVSNLVKVSGVTTNSSEGTNVEPAVRKYEKSIVHASNTLIPVSRNPGVNYTLQQVDISKLDPGQWLDDNIMNSYGAHLAARSQSSSTMPSVYWFSSYFFGKLRDEGYESVSRWTRLSDLFAHDILLVPIHLGNHWCLGVANIPLRTLQYYDPMVYQTRRNFLRIGARFFHLMSDYLNTEFQKRNFIQLDPPMTSCTVPTNAPIQQNGFDCGMFCLMYAETISRNAQFTFTQLDMPILRRQLQDQLISQQNASLRDVVSTTTNK